MTFGDLQKRLCALGFSWSGLHLLVVWRVRWRKRERLEACLACLGPGISGCACNAHTSWTFANLETNCKKGSNVKIFFVAPDLASLPLPVSEVRQLGSYASVVASVHKISWCLRLPNSPLWLNDVMDIYVNFWGRRDAHRKRLVFSLCSMALSASDRVFSSSLAMQTALAGGY